MGFNLLTEPWLPLLRLDGTMEDVGLLDAIRNARNYRRLVGTTPTMTAALHRTLLALVHRAYQPVDAERWVELWTAEPGLPEQRLIDYQDEYGHRFDLFHPQEPFFQCPALDNTPGTTAKLVAYRATGSNRTLFDQTTADQRPLLEPAEAARWLITTQAYDTSGTKQPYRTVRHSEGGLGNRYACVLVEGRSLHETLLLNLLLYNPDAELPPRTTPGDRPVWEEHLPPGPEPDIRSPRGWTDLLTWPSRRILLSSTEVRGRTMVNGVVLTPGTIFKGDLAEVEAMTACRRPWLKGNKQGNLRPVSLDQLRGVWQHSQELLLAADPRWWNTWKARRRANGPLPAQEPERQRPAALEHIADLVEDGLIAEDTVYTLRVFGQQLGDQGGDTYAWNEEAIPAPVALLRAENARVGHVIGYAASLANDLGEALHTMQRSYRSEFKSEPTKKQDQLPSDLEIWYWPRLNAPFAQFIRELGEAVRGIGSETTAAEKWGETASRLAEQAAWQWLQGTPRRDRSLMAASAHFDDFQEASRHLQKIFRGGLARYTAPPEVTE
ncbi:MULTISPECIES: type I-E CRISPR-associated protein Cse1/CasA [Streptomyces]|uniref:type I-E CRISPR-associated protein Cse1/CasA n=1 Tax=Streptomyces TaxID=1883 RepID=UPI00369730E1